MMRLETLNTIAALNAAAVTAANAEKIGNKRVYYCQRCLNHNRLEPRKNHKCDCMYANCTCNKCILVEKRRVLNTQLHDLEEISDVDIKVENTEEISITGRKGERVPNCQKCGQHGRKSRLKGHKRMCPYKDCSCPKCQVVSERQKLMADQIKIRRRQRKDTLMNFTRKKITDTLNAAAVVAATTPMPYLNGFNALLYKQIQQNMQPQAGLLTCASPNGSNSAESSSYSPTNSIGCFTPSPSDVQQSKTTTPTTPTTMPNQTAPLTTQLPLLFSPTNIVTQPGLLSSSSPATSATSSSSSSSSSVSASTATSTATAAATVAAATTATTPVSTVDAVSMLQQIAVPIAINPLLAGCSTPTTTFTDPLNSTSVSSMDKLTTNVITATPTPVATTLPTNPLAFGIHGLLNNKHIIESFLANMRLLEQKICAGIKHEDSSNTVVDVCSI